jgi:Trk K+ transport system NAD-binding subunit
MRIIIAGMGDVGYHLAKELSQDEHDIIAIDQNQQRLSKKTGRKKNNCSYSKRRVYGKGN